MFKPSVHSAISVARGRMWIGLYNSYDPVRFHEAHRRALARAGPIAVAYDANLCTFGFPYGLKDVSTPLEIVEWVAGTTSIGESGAYLVDLAKEGRFHVFDFPKKGFPPQLGTIVVTTNHPLQKKAITAEGVQETFIVVKGGYSPDTVRVASGRPVKLTFNRQESDPCSELVVLDAFGVSAELPQGSNVSVEFTPTEAGSYEFTCGMGMLRGRVVAS